VVILVLNTEERERFIRKLSRYTSLVASMRTYVRMLFNSEGAEPKEVVGIMRELGFEPSFGTHDFVYKWDGKKTSIEDVLDLIGKMHKRMKGLNLSYEITTVS